MEWISANWIWLLLGLGMVGMHMFGHGHGSRGGHGSGHGHGGHGGGCCGGMGGHGHGQPKPQPEEATGGTPERAIDPVCGMPVPPTGSKTAIHNGRVYRFCSRECREVFEANPDLYLAEGAKPASVPSVRPHHHPTGGARHA